MKQKIEGDDLMLFKQGKSIAYATNHTMTVQCETTDITSKQSGGRYRSVRPRLISWQLTSENIYTQDEAVALYSAMNSAARLTVIMGRKSSGADSLDDASLNYWSPAQAGYWTGHAYVTNIQVNSPAGEKATFSVTLDGDGELEYME